MTDLFKAALARPLTRNAMAAVVVASSFLLRFGIIHFIGAELPPFIFLYPAVMMAAVLGGLGPGLVATALGVLGTDYLVLPPVHHFAISRAAMPPTFPKP